MKPGFECSVTASFLDSGRVLCNASHCAAIIAGIGVLVSHGDRERLLLGVSMLCWLVACYLGVRVAIDASLFRHLAGEPVDGGQALDELLRTWGLSRASSDRTPAERSRGALKFWKRLIVIVIVQVAILGAGLAA